LRVVAAFLAARERVAVFRFRVAAPFFAAATRFGDFLVVLRAADFRVVDLRAVVLRPVRFRVEAAFLPAATRFGDFLVVLRAVDLRAVDLRAVVLRPVRFLVEAAFLPAATRFGDFLVVLRAVVFFAVDRFATERFLVAADFFADATCCRVSSRFSITAGSDIGPAAGVSPVEPSPDRHGSGLGKSIPC
jgi:hypothetical protein